MQTQVVGLFCVSGNISCTFEKYLKVFFEISNTFRMYLNANTNTSKIAFRYI